VTARHPAAFFDFDGTLIRGDSQAMEATRRLRHEPNAAVLALRLIPTMVSGVLAGLDLVSQRTHNQAYLSTYRGRKEIDLIEQAEALFASKIRPAFILPVLEIMAMHRQAGDVIAIVSATPRHLLAPVENHLKPDLLICTRLESDALGRCTGRPLGGICTGPEKAKRIRDLAARQRLDLAASHAYTDDPVDLPMLTRVGHPHVVNPSKRLEKMARKQGWQIHRF
jgi:HAD superfamily hydrolase (TIGR01490 family)